jgi:hypothetical protein
MVTGRCPLDQPPSDPPNWRGPGPGARQAVQGERGGPEPLDLLLAVALDGPAWAHHPQDLGGKRPARSSLAPRRGGEKEQPHRSDDPAATSHQDQPSTSWAATPSAAPTTMAAR